MLRSVFRVVALLGVLALPAQAADVMVGQLKISAPWARATPKGASIGGGYLTITNTGGEPDRLVGGATEVAKDVEIHEMRMDSNVMKMRPVADGLEIKPGQTVTLKPGGYHLMFVGLKRQLKQGEHVKATLTFAKAGNAELDFTVEGLGAQGKGANGHDTMPAKSGHHGGMPMKH
jgi:copper(I)-binding protein